MKVISSSYTRLIRVAGLLSLFAVAVLPMRVMAQTPAAPAANTQSNGVAQLEQKYMQVRTQLGQIEAKTVKTDAALVKQRESFRQQLIAVMKKNGDDPLPMIASLKSLGKQIQDTKLTASERQKLLDKAQQTQVTLLRAERKALQDPKLQAASKDLQNATLAAMRKVDPNTDTLINEMRSLQTEIIKARSGSGK